MKIEVSNGEIVDKLTILEIKLRNSDCDQKSKQIVKEMTYLSPIVEELNIPDELICLLYTSPSPRDLSTSRMPSSA